MNDLYEQALAALHSVWNRRWLALAVAWLVCLVGWMAVALIPNTYESKTRIFVKLEDVLAQQVGIGSGSVKRDIDRVRETMTSSANLEKIIRSTRLGDEVTSPRQMDAAIAALAKQIEARSEKENLFEITATSGRSDLSDGDNAKLAQTIVQKLIDVFRQENFAGSRGEMRETLAFLDQQLTARQKDLEAAEQKRLAFEAAHPQLIGGAQALAQKLDTSSTSMRNTEADLAAAQSALAAIDGQLAGTPRTLVVAGQGGGARGALAQAEADITSMRARGLTESHPDMIAANKQIAMLRKQAAAAGSDAGSTPNPAYTSLLSIRADRQATIQALIARKAGLQAEVTAIAANQTEEPGVAAEAQRISRDYDVLRKQYDKLLQDREELRLRGQVENERNSVKFEVLDPPSAPRSPAAPNRPLLLFGVLIAGIGAGVGTAFAMGQLRSTYATANSLERSMGMPVLGTISFSLTDAARVLQSKRNKQFVAAGAALCGLFVVLLAVEFIQRGSVA
jgi:polysaccharide chain length determinant protein (PEP-CTERM system associated)